MYEGSYDGGAGLAAGLGAMMWLFIAAFYLYFAFTQYKIAQKCGCHENAWWAFIPILNVFQLTQMAQKEWWWFVLCLVPIVNIVAIAVLWSNAAKQAGHASFWGILMLVPFINIVALGVMAFTDGNSRPTPPSDYTPRRESEPVS